MFEGLLIIAIFVLTVIPLFKLLPTYGIHPFWSFAAVVPLGVVVLLWIMAARTDRREGR